MSGIFDRDGRGGGVSEPVWWERGAKCLARPIAQGLFDAGHVFAELSQNPFELFAAWHLGAKLLKDERIGRFANSPGCCVGGLGFQPAQAPAIDKRLWILAYWRTTKL